MWKLGFKQSVQVFTTIVMFYVSSEVLLPINVLSLITIFSKHFLLCGIWKRDSRFVLRTNKRNVHEHGSNMDVQPLQAREPWTSYITGKPTNLSLFFHRRMTIA